tara:strand:+ start:3414 stop:4622 length:1209 start_codon:yes stop_codon:yes gene_type:complete
MAQLDNIPAMLQSGEYVVRKEAVDKLGKDTMDMINNADRLGYMGGGLVPQGEHGHSAIDELLALNTLANQRGVDMTRDSAMMNKGGKVLKKAPEGNKGLMKLPEEVRNRMGYMMEGGMMDNYMDGGMKYEYMDGGMYNKKKKKTYEDGGSVGVVNKIGKARKMFSDIDDLLATAALMDNYTFGPMQRKTLGSMREAGMVDPKETMQQVMMLLKAREQNKIPSFEKRKSYIDGGGVGVEGYEQPSPNDYFQEIYETFGFMPSDAGIRADFEKRFEYDPSEAVGQIEDLTREAGDELSNVIQRTQAQGQGFEEFGRRERTVDTARSDIYEAVDRGAEDISTESKLQQQEEALLDLAQIEESGAELDTMRPGPPPMPSGFILPGSTREMSDGTYVWAINQWVKAS